MTESEQARLRKLPELRVLLDECQAAAEHRRSPGGCNRKAVRIARPWRRELCLSHRPSAAGWTTPREVFYQKRRSDAGGPVRRVMASPPFLAPGAFGCRGTEARFLEGHAPLMENGGMAQDGKALLRRTVGKEWGTAGLRPAKTRSRHLPDGQRVPASHRRRASTTLSTSSSATPPPANHFDFIGWRDA